MGEYVLPWKRSVICWKSKNDLEVRSVVDRQYPRLALMLGRCHAANMLWQSYAQDESTATSATAPTARWIMKVDTLGATRL